MSREYLELEKIIFSYLYHNKDGAHIFGRREGVKILKIEKKDAKILTEIIASAILTWHKQREVELLEKILENTGSNINGLGKRYIQQLINERMVGK